EAICPDVRAVYIESDPAKTPAVRDKWERWGEGQSLVVLESPYRSLVQPLLAYIDEVELEREDDQIVVVIPEFVPAKWWEKVLHGHSGLLLKLALLHRPNVIVCNVRYFLAPFTGPVRFASQPLVSLDGADLHAEKPRAAAPQLPLGEPPEPLPRPL